MGHHHQSTGRAACVLGWLCASMEVREEAGLGLVWHIRKAAGVHEAL